MTRRKLFQALAGLPLVGRLVAVPSKPNFPDGLRALMAMPTIEEVIWKHGVTHYVGYDTGRSDVNVVAPHQFHATVAEALKNVVPGRGDTVVVAAGHQAAPLLSGSHTIYA